jgi:hypothetical protein
MISWFQAFAFRFNLYRYSLDEYENWARDPMKSSGFDGRNLINNGAVASAPRTGSARDILFAIENAIGGAVQV